jgi:hypothetical protein
MYNKVDTKGGAMKRLFWGLFLFGIAGFSFSLEIQIPMYFVHANNFLSGEMIPAFNLEVQHPRALRDRESG